MTDREREQVDYIVCYYKDGQLRTISIEFNNEEDAKSFAASQQKHYEGVELFVIKRTTKREAV